MPHPVFILEIVTLIKIYHTLLLLYTDAKLPDFTLTLYLLYAVLSFWHPFSLFLSVSFHFITYMESFHKDTQFLVVFH